MSRTTCAGTPASRYRLIATLLGVALVATAVVATGDGGGTAVVETRHAAAYEPAPSQAAPTPSTTSRAQPARAAATPQPRPGPDPRGAETGRARSVGHDLVAFYDDLLRVARDSGTTGREIIAAAPTRAEFERLVERLTADELEALADATRALPVDTLRVQLRAARLTQATAVNRGAKAAEAGLHVPAPAALASKPRRAGSVCEYVASQYTPLRSTEFTLAIAVIITEAGAKVAEDLTKPDPTGISELAAVLPLVIITSVLKGLLIGASAALDLANCINPYLFDRVTATDNTLVEAFGLIEKQDAGLVVLAKGLKAAAEAVEEDAPPGTGAPGGGAPPQEAPAEFDLAAVLAALDESRLQVQQAQAGSTQALANQLRTAQETLGERVRRLRDHTEEQRAQAVPAGAALVIGRELAGGGAPLVDLVLPASVGGLLDAPGGVRDVVEQAMAAAAAQGLAHDEQGARAAFSDGQRALAAQDWKAAFRHYRAAYLAVAS